MFRACRAVAALLAGAAACLPATASADAPVPSLHDALGAPPELKLTLATRLRYEWLDGQPRAGLNPTDQQLALRTNLVLEYAAGPLRIGGELQDSRAWLGKAGSAISTADVNAVEPVQAWVGLDLPGALGPGSKATVEAGRFTFNLGSRRFIASDDYRNATSAYTGLRAVLKGRGGAGATLFYLLPQVRLPDDLAGLLANRPALDRESFDLQLMGALVTRPATLLGGAAELGFYRLVERDAPGRPTRDRHLNTVSARLVREARPGRPDFDLEAAWQTGHASTSAAATAAVQQVDAGMVHAALGWTFPGAAKAHVTLLYDWIGGDRPGGANTRFDTLFGGRRFEFPPAGIFAVIGRANLSAPGLRVDLAPGKRFDAMAAWRAMWLASPADAFSQTGVIDKTGASGRFAGHNIDLRARYWLVPGRLRGEVDYDWIGKGRFLRDAPNAPATGNTHYAAVALTASF
ncbi:alginate export family protein [Novosphingobium bradum]|uniref:Alginate export family protein n=1 Tax=Novosphingobium bradum TaxID=1737444 RepID=A0ABV7IMU3_9SPHN